MATPAISAIDTITCSGDGDLPLQRAGFGTAAILMVGVAHGGPLRRMTWRSPDTYHSAGNGRGTATLKFCEGVACQRDGLWREFRDQVTGVADDAFTY